MSLLDWKWQYYRTFFFINYQMCPEKKIQIRGYKEIVFF